MLGVAVSITDGCSAELRAVGGAGDRGRVALCGEGSVVRSPAHLEMQIGDGAHGEVGADVGLPSRRGEEHKCTWRSKFQAGV